MTYKNGDVYEGRWWADKKHFRGKMTYANGNVYNDTWRDDQYETGELKAKELKKWKFGMFVKNDDII